MTKATINRDIDAFRKATQSLRLYRRAELKSEAGEGIVDLLYVDPLPNSHVLETMLKPNSTFLVGRKGTGKSTVFQRAQSELRKGPNATTAYVDIKSVYEASRADADLLASTAAHEGVLNQSSLERLDLSRYFMKAILWSIRSELQKRVQSRFWDQVRLRFGGTLAELFSGVDALLAEADTVHFTSVMGSYVSNIAEQASSASSASVSVESGASVTGSANPSAKLASGAKARFGTHSTSSEEATHADILMRVFDLQKFISQLKDLLNKCDIHHLYIFLDDFSELPEPAMRVVVDALVAPLNNWSEELIKFKIAAYPTRIYFGAIDKTKIDEINLDLYNMYGTTDLAAMEEKAIDFTKRLVMTRLDHFNVVSVNKILDGAAGDEVWRQIFYATMANPRNIGWLLHFAYESSLLYGRPITSGVIRDAARRYYEEKIAASFEMNKFLSESFEERSSIFSLKDLLDSIVDRARDLRKRDHAIFRNLEGRAPTSHFHVALDREALLNTLELNFFVTKYYVLSSKDARKVAIYALNYGLCQSKSIEFGRPHGSRGQRYRQYYAERVFDYTPVLDAYVKNNQEIVCGKCQARHEMEQLSALRAYGMLCPTCREGQCELVNLSRKYEDALRAVSAESLLPAVELGILQALDSENRPLNASDVAAELDCSYQLVGKRAKYLDERGLVIRGGDQQNRRVYRPTPLASATYFAK
ncbi:methyltransferase family protein [Clavibacter michiganensis]|uniref:methyltransferase family protein n=1 Tax=Clavibacter michiganensis TaxID=28447 RepID=UPI003EB9D5BB